MADNLSEIKTVKDLLDLNTRNHELTESELSQKFDEIIDLGPRVGLAFTKGIIEHLLNYHCVRAEEEISENNADSASVWSVDASKLFIISNIIDDIEL